MTTETTGTVEVPPRDRFTGNFLCDTSVRLGKLLEKFEGGEIRKYTRVIKKDGKKDIIVTSYHLYHVIMLQPQTEHEELIKVWDYWGEFSSLQAARAQAMLPTIKHPVKKTAPKSAYERTKTGVSLSSSWDR